IRDAIKHYYGGDVTLASLEEFGFARKESENATAPGKSQKQPDRKDECEQLNAGLKLEQVAILIRRLDSLPALPETVNRVRESMDDLDITPRQVAGFIVQDPPIAAKVLSV